MAKLKSDSPPYRRHFGILAPFNLKLGLGKEVNLLCLLWALDIRNAGLNIDNIRGTPCFFIYELTTI